MSKLFNRNAFIPFGIFVCLLLAFLRPPMTSGLLLLIVGTVVSVVAALVWKAPPPTIAEVLNRVERPTRS